MRIKCNQCGTIMTPNAYTTKMLPTGEAYSNCGTCGALNYFKDAEVEDLTPLEPSIPIPPTEPEPEPEPDTQAAPKTTRARKTTK